MFGTSLHASPAHVQLAPKPKDEMQSFFVHAVGTPDAYTHSSRGYVHGAGPQGYSTHGCANTAQYVPWQTASP